MVCTLGSNGTCCKHIWLIITLLSSYGKSVQPAYLHIQQTSLIEAIERMQVFTLLLALFLQLVSNCVCLPAGAEKLVHSGFIGGFIRALLLQTAACC